MKIPVEGYKGLYRDKLTGAIINSNDFEYQEYLKLKEIKTIEKTEIEKLKSEIEELKLLVKLLGEKI